MSAASTENISHPSIQRARRIAHLLDSALTIPVINKRIGLDPILGALPGLGDVITAILSCYVLYVAYELGLPKKIFLRMLVNIAIDSVIGLIPIYGDFVDAMWKANTQNVEILEAAYLKYGDRRQFAEQHAAQSAVVDVTAEPID